MTNWTEVIRVSIAALAFFVGGAQLMIRYMISHRLEFAPAAGFHRSQLEDPRNLALVRDALYEVTGRRLAVETVVGGPEEPEQPDEPHELSEEDVISLLKDTFDAEEVEDH